MAIFESAGLKRKIAAWLATVLELAQSYPELAPIVVALQPLVAALGGVAVGHAAAKGTVEKHPLLSTSAILSILIGVSHFIPVMQPFVPLLSKLAAFFGAAGIGRAMAKPKQSDDNEDGYTSTTRYERGV